METSEATKAPTYDYEPVAEARGVAVHYGGIKAVDGVSLGRVGQSGAKARIIPTSNLIASLHWESRAHFKPCVFCPNEPSGTTSFCPRMLFLSERVTRWKG